MSRPRLGRTERLDVALVATVVALAGVTIAMILIPSLRARVLAPALDLALDSAAFVVTSSIAGLAWVRYRERHESFALFQSTAFLVLAIANTNAILETIGPDIRSPLTMTEPGHEQLYVFTAARMLTAIFLVIGGYASLRGRRPGHPRLILATSAVAMTALVAWIHVTSASLPALITPIGPTLGQLPTSAPAMTPVGAATQVLGAVLFGAAAVICRELWRRDRSIGDAYVTFGLVLAAFAQVLGAISPSTHPGPVASGDFLRIGFYLTLLLAIEAEARALLSRLQRANRTLEQLRYTEVERAALEERAWLSRELHDGLAQDLWLAKLKVGRLSGLGLSEEARTVAGEVSGAIDLGLAEARQAVVALRMAAESEDTFGELMGRFVEDFEDRFGLRVEFECSPDLPALPVRTQAELLRIAQEALTNARRHADATIVRVRACTEGSCVSLTVIDNGHGFDVSKARTGSFGIDAMRERAAIIGGGLTISSAPGDGTRVDVTAPLVHARGGLA